MIVGQEEVMARLYKIGAGAAAVGAIHILTLLLSWYIESNGKVVAALVGYVFPESLIFSVAGGLMAGIGLLIAYVVKRVIVTKLVIGALAVIGGVLALFSPLYIYFYHILELGIRGYPDIGFFAAIFTGIVQIGVGALALLTPTKREIIPTAAPEITPTPAFEPAPTPPPPTTPRTRRPRGPATARIVPATDIEEATCSICYEPVKPEDAVKCSACGAIFHRGCIDTWVSLNGTCPVCKAVIVG